MINKIWLKIPKGKKTPICISRLDRRVFTLLQGMKRKCPPKMHIFGMHPSHAKKQRFPLCKLVASILAESRGVCCVCTAFRQKANDCTCIPNVNKMMTKLMLDSQSVCCTFCIILHAYTKSLNIKMGQMACQNSVCERYMDTLISAPENFVDTEL